MTSSTSTYNTLNTDSTACITKVRDCCINSPDRHVGDYWVTVKDTFPFQYYLNLVIIMAQSNNVKQSVHMRVSVWNSKVRDCCINSPDRHVGIYWVTVKDTFPIQYYLNLVIIMTQSYTVKPCDAHHIPLIFMLCT